MRLLSCSTRIQKSRSARREWVKNWKLDRDRFGHMPLIRELKENYPDDYRNYWRINARTFIDCCQCFNIKLLNKIQ